MSPVPKKCVSNVAFLVKVSRNNAQLKATSLSMDIFGIQTQYITHSYKTNAFTNLKEWGEKNTNKTSIPSIRKNKVTKLEGNLEITGSYFVSEL